VSLTSTDSVAVFDLTAQVGAHSLARLQSVPSRLDERVIHTALGTGHGRIPIVWQRIAVLDPASLAPSRAQIFLLGPGSLAQIQKLEPQLVRNDGQRRIFILTPNALLEAFRLQSLLRANAADSLVLQLPTSDPEAFWAVLIEEFKKFPAIDDEGTPFFQHEDDISMGPKDAMAAAMSIEGALATALVNHTSGMCLAQAGSGIDLELAAAGNTEVVRAKLKTMESLNLKKGIEDILITLGDQYHLIRLAPNHPGLFIYLVLDRARGNLALARYKLGDIERALKV
jgi:hypothetical protein